MLKFTQTSFFLTYLLWYSFTVEDMYFLQGRISNFAHKYFAKM